MENQKTNPPNLSTSNLPIEPDDNLIPSEEKIDEKALEKKASKYNYSKIIKLAVRIAGPLLTASSILVGVWQFQVQQRITDEQDFKRRIWEKRLESYMEIGDLAAQLMINVPKKKKFDSLYYKFEQMYWGKLPIFEDSIVEARMKHFRDELYSISVNEGDSTNLKVQGYLLMHACQESLKKH